MGGLRGEVARMRSGRRSRGLGFKPEAGQRLWSGGFRRLRPYRKSRASGLGRMVALCISGRGGGLDIGGDGGRKQARAWIASAQAAAKFGGGDIFVDGREQVDAGALVGVQSELGRLRNFGREGNSGRLTTIHSARARSWSGERHLRIVRKLSAPVRTKRASGGIFAGERGEGVDGVVRLTVGRGEHREQRRGSRRTQGAGRPMEGSGSTRGRGPSLRDDRRRRRGGSLALRG